MVKFIVVLPTRKILIRCHSASLSESQKHDYLQKVE